MPRKPPPLASQPRLLARMLARRRRGMSLATYGLLTGLVAIITIPVLIDSGETVDDLFGDVGDTMDGAVNGPDPSPSMSPVPAGLAVDQTSVTGMDVDGSLGSPAEGSPVDLTFSNTGTEPTGTLNTTNSNGSNFEITLDGCTGIILAGLEACVITVKPKATGDSSIVATLSVGDGVLSASASLSGTASNFPCESQPGNVCAGGAVYVGLSPDGDVPMYVTACDRGMSWNGSSCTGTRQGLSWNSGSTSYTSTGMQDCTYFGDNAFPENSCKTGKSNSAFLAAISGTWRAAEYCESLNIHGHSDWYLPAIRELGVIYQNRNRGQLAGTFTTTTDSTTRPGRYWSSSDGFYLGHGVHGDNAWEMRFFNGSYGSYSPEYPHNIRCARR